MSSAPAPAAAHPVPRGAWLALAVVLGAAFMSLLDTTIVNVALPTIRTSLDASESTLSWIISGYALAFGLALIPAGRLGDRYGHKWVFITGLALFTAEMVEAEDVAELAQGAIRHPDRVATGPGMRIGFSLPCSSACMQLR